MGDYESVPSSWNWIAASSSGDLGAAVAAEGGRLISIHRPDGGSDQPYTGVWVVDPDDEQVAWDWQPAASAADLDGLVDAAKGRLVEIDAFVTDGGDVMFAGVWVLGDAASSVDWGWDPEMSKSDLRNRARTDRLICLSTYVVGGQRRYAAVWVRDKREWDWRADVGFEDLQELLHDFPGRLVSLDPFLNGAELRFAALWVDAEDEFAKLWWWEVGSDEPTVAMNCELFCSHLVQIRRIPGSADAFVHFRHGFPRPPYAESADLVQIGGTAELTDVTDWMAPFDQQHELELKLSNVAGETVEILDADLLSSTSGWSHPGESWPLFDPAWNPPGILAGEPTTMVPAASYAATVPHGGGIGATHYVVRVRAQAADGRTQLATGAIPILRNGYGAPEAIEATAPVYLGVWCRPLEVVPVFKEGEVLNWLTVGGAVVNNTGQTLRIGGLHLTLEAGGDLVDDRELKLNFRYFSDPEFKVFEPVPAPTTQAHAELPTRFSYFVDGFALPAEFDPDVGCDLTLVLNYKIEGWCGAAEVRTRAEYVNPVLMTSPVSDQWHWGNSAAHVDFDAHAWPGQRLALDLTQRGTDGSELKDDPDSSTGKADPTQNDSYYAYGQPVRAVAKGEVLMCEFGQTAENNGNEPVVPPPPGNNWVLLRHDTVSGLPRRSGYYHLRPIQPDPGSEMKPGDVVQRGQLIGYVGNIGASSAPHLHWGWAELDGTGRGRLRPVRCVAWRRPPGRTSRRRRRTVTM